jgi:hypothetical protein
VIQTPVIEGVKRCEENIDILEAPNMNGDQLFYTLPFEQSENIHKLLALLE